MVERRLGKVVAVCLKGQRGMPKYPQPQAMVGPYGIEGDYHAGPLDRHVKEGPPQPNRRQVTIVAKEVLNSVNQLLGTNLQAGSLGENILLEGHGDLSDFQPGDKIKLGEHVVLEVTTKNRACSALAAHHPNMVEQLESKRGLSAIVIKTGVVKPGDVSQVGE